MMRVEIKERLDNNTFKVVRSGVSSRITLSGLGDYNPEPGTEAFVIPVGNDPDDFVMVAVNDGKLPESEPGERLIYSVSGGDVKAIIHLKNNGEIVLNRGEDSAVKYGPLDTAISSWGASVVGDLNVFAAAFLSLGVTVTPATTSAPDISSAEQDKVKL